MALKLISDGFFYALCSSVHVCVNTNHNNFQNAKNQRIKIAKTPNLYVFERFREHHEHLFRALLLEEIRNIFKKTIKMR